MSIKLKITAIVIASLLILSALAGGITAIVLNEINKSNAYRGTESSISVGNLLTDDGTSMNVDTFNELMKHLDAIGSVSSVQNSNDINGGNPLIFQMGEVNSNKIYWQVVYRTKDYITVWMTEPYTAEYFNNSGNSINNSDLAGYTTGKYSDYGNYSQSVIRDVTLGIYNEMLGSFSALSSFIVSPQIMATNTGVDWQSVQDYKKVSGSYNSTTDGLGNQTNDSANNPHGWTYNSCMSDMFWIPSYIEVHYNSTEHDSDSWPGNTGGRGLWALPNNEKGFNNSSTALDGTSGVNSSCWLRSGYSSYSGSAVQIHSSGAASSTTVYGSYGVRPAAHISLSSLQNLVKYNVTTAVTPEGSGTASGGQSNITPNTEITLTATANTGYSFVGWSLDGGNTIIPESIGKSEYTITVTQDATYTAVFEGGITITSANPSAEFTILRESNDGVTHSYLIQTVGTNYLERIAVIQSGTPNEEDYNKVSAIDGYISGQEYCTAVHYITNNTGNSFVLEVYNATSPFIIYLDFTDTSQNFKPAGSLDGVGVSVAYQSADGTISTGSTSADGTPLYAIGEARIQGYTTTENLTEVIVIAKAYTDYEFKGWMVDGEFISYIDENDNEITLTGITHLSARIPFEIANGKQIFAVFGAVDSSHLNDDTDSAGDIL